MSDVLKAAIESSGLSLNELGRRAGIDHGQLSRFLRGERDLTLTNAGKVAEALGLALLPAKPKERKRAKGG